MERREAAVHSPSDWNRGGYACQEGVDAGSGGVRRDTMRISGKRGGVREHGYKMDILYDQTYIMTIICNEDLP